MNTKIALPLLIVIYCYSCNNNKKNESLYKTTGTIEKLDAALDAIISSSAKAEIIAEGFEWSEGPLWIEKHNMLLFSDVPMNTVYKWTEEKGKEVYLNPSGYTGSEQSKSKEPGSNGLTLDNKGNLILCQHGNRQVARMAAMLDSPAAKFTTLAGLYNGKRLSSPNDAVYNTKGEIFFTDPPYGLPTQNDDDPEKEITFNGVYEVTTGGTVLLLTDSITRPNGLAFFPGETKLLVANSDPDRPNWYLINTIPGNSHAPVLFHSAAGYDKKLKGLPDGLKIDSKGNVFATGPGGVWIFDSTGKLLGKIKLDEATSNIALTPDEKTMYITNDMQVLRLKMRN
jgi:gluconolactonase